jgi:hypothetical protein
VGYDLCARQVVELGGAAGMVEVEMGEQNPAEIAGTPANLLDVCDDGISVSGETRIHDHHLFVCQKHNITTSDALYVVDSGSYFHLGIFFLQDGLSLCSNAMDCMPSCPTMSRRTQGVILG